MARGLIQGALQGLGESVQQFGTMALQNELLAMREQRLAEIQAQRDDKMMGHQSAMAERQITASAEQNQLTRAHQSTLQQTSLEHAAEMANQSRAHASSEAAATRMHTTGENTATRTHQERLAQSAERAANARHGASMALQEKQIEIAAKGAELDREIKQIQVNNAKRVDALQSEFRTTTDPARKSAIKDEIQTLTGKDNDNFIPVPIKDETGAITGYEVFDKKAGKFVAGERGGPPKAAPPPAAIDYLRKNAGDEKVLRDFRTKYGVDPRTLLATEQPKPKPAPRSSTPAPSAPGLAQVLDEQRPHRQPYTPLTDDDYMPAP